MNRKNPPATPSRPALLVEALEPRIAPAGLLESKFTSVAVGGSLLLDASGAPGTYQGLTTGTGGGSGSYLLYITSGRALVFTTDINGNGRLDPGEITGISLGKDSLGHNPAITLFSDVNGDIITNLAGTSGSNLTDSDRNPNNGRDGQLLTDTTIDSITLRTLTASDIDSTIAGNTVNARLALTSFSVHGNIVAGGGISAVTIDTTGTTLLAAKFNGSAGDQLYRGSIPTITGLYTGTAANNLDYHFTQNNIFTPQVEGTLANFPVPAGEHGGDISNVAAASASTTFSIGIIATGDGGTSARGGNISGVSMHGATGGYELLAGNGGQGSSGGAGGSILNFTDLGSITDQVILHTGAGGAGLLGTGGAGGLATFVNPKIAAQVEVLMGDGGAGFGTGGAGASLTTGNFVTPETQTPIGGKFYGTWHAIGDVGTTHPTAATAATGTNPYLPEAIDFNGDGYGDAVYTSSVPDQVVVVFGNGFGDLATDGGNFNHLTTAYLKVPGVTNPVVTIGDFNGDGRPDIAVASGSASNFAGIYVFFDQIGTGLDPINANNYTHSAVGDHPFSASHETALPSLADLGYYQTSGGIVALAAGDYNGDGITDIAYVRNIVAEGTLGDAQTVGVLLGDGLKSPTNHAQYYNTTTGLAVGSGYFYANTAAPRAAASLLNVIVRTGVGDTLQATSLTNTNVPTQATATTPATPAAPEVFIFSSQGAGQFDSFSLNLDPTTHVPITALPGNGLIDVPIGLGRVDTNRNTGPNNISLVDANLQGFTIQDVDGDGNADVVVLTKLPANFLVTFQGDGTTAFAKQSGSGDNAGVFLGTGRTGIAITGSDTNVTPAPPTDPAAPPPTSFVGTFDTVAVEFLPTIPGPYVQEILLRDGTNAPSFGNFVNGRSFLIDSSVQDLTVTALDAFYVQTPAAAGTVAPDVGYGVLVPESSTYVFADLNLLTATNDSLTGFLSGEHYLTNNGYIFTGGNGGSSVTGVGGKGGVIGGTATSLGGGIGAITVTLPASTSYEGQLFFQGGGGADGFGGGGIGGDVTGLAVRYAAGTGVLTSTAEIFAGNAGSGTGGDGGRGGNLSQLSIETGTVFTAGNGGAGVHGGTGGSITGNAQSVYDTYTSNVILTTGSGGQGALQGGNGGVISAWDSEFADFVGTGGFLTYQTGSGGGAVGGAGGSGGGIVNSSPDQSQNNLSGPLTLLTGSGGSGLAGGSGGVITNFINTATNQSAVPTTLTVITGSGGVGVSGAGGAGGTITNFSANATGLSTLSGFEDFVGIGRIIAGNGGASFGAAGGAGGSLNKIVSTATSAPLVVAAGAGGDGLTIGGDGGSVTNATINSAALLIGKMIVVGGKGGDAYAAQRTDVTVTDAAGNADNDTTDLAHMLLAFGATQGMAGNGGNISNIVQPAGAQTAVDLIGGNGGSTPNASTAVSAATGVGRGGSITGITLTGTVGAISRDTTQGTLTNPAIKGYSFTDANGVVNTSVTGFVDFISAVSNPANLLNFNSANFVLDDTVGNVGIVAGAAGTVRGGQPASNGINGDVTNIIAQSYLSIVAGSVTNVAPVRILSGLTVTNPDGVLGADKSQLSEGLGYGPNGRLDYLDPTLGVVTTLRAGDALIDGAIFASTIQSTTGVQIRGPRVFPATAA